MDLITAFEKLSEMYKNSEKPRCPKCGGRLDFDWSFYYIDFSVHENRKCLECGLILFPLEFVKMPPPFGIMWKKVNYKEGKKITWVQCPVCFEGKFARERNTRGLCRKCGDKLSCWQSRQPNTPCPFIKKNGEWVVNPERLVYVQTRRTRIHHSTIREYEILVSDNSSEDSP